MPIDYFIRYKNVDNMTKKRYSNRGRNTIQCGAFQDGKDWAKAGIHTIIYVAGQVRTGEMENDKRTGRKNKALLFLHLGS